MCAKCDELQKKIDQYRRVLTQPYDPLTEERLKAAIQDLEKEIIAKHP